MLSERNSPAGQNCDRLSTRDINLACAHRATLERMQQRLNETEHPQLQVAAELIDEASLYLSLAIAGQ